MAQSVATERMPVLRKGAVGRTVEIGTHSLLLDGKRWLPVMGEIHYARYPREEWRDALLRMKAGGISIVATYVFWIHHEEVESAFDWSGRRNLREFVQLCDELGLYAVVRLGPWCHGECRNGGFPDWLRHSGLPLRSNDPRYLAKVTMLYHQIADQLDGLLLKDGGPVIGVQVENEFTGPAAHLVELKRIACEAGVEVPLYTYTGWLAPREPIPDASLVPLFGGYAEGFWDRNLEPMPGDYWRNFTFARERSDNAIATDQVAVRQCTETSRGTRHPYLTCEVGGGMACSYHRRIRISPADVVAVALCKIGSGGNLPGYYMYHGGTNPDGKLSSMQESQATGYWNDLPEKTYDFLAPIGEFGQIREHYHLLRRLHLFLHDFGSELAGMTAILPDDRPAHAKDSTLRWCTRTDDNSGYLFVNNYQRLLRMPARPDVQFPVQLSGRMQQIPQRPITIPEDASFVLPVNLALADDDSIRLLYATAQPICRLADGEDLTFVFAAIAGVASEFVITAKETALEYAAGEVTTAGNCITVANLPSGRSTALRLRSAGGARVALVLLSERDSLECYKGAFAGRERIVLSSAPVVFDRGELHLSMCESATVCMFPTLPSILADGKRLEGADDGLFRRFTVALPGQSSTMAAEATLVRPARAARVVPMGEAGVAQAPVEADFEDAAVWQIRFSGTPAPTSTAPNPLLRIAYVGDVARLYLDGKLIADNFYNGSPFDLGIGRFAPEIYQKPLLLKILPLRKDAPIQLPVSDVPLFDGAAEVVSLCSLNIVTQVGVKLCG